MKEYLVKFIGNGTADKWWRQYARQWKLMTGVWIDNELTFRHADEYKMTVTLHCNNMSVAENVIRHLMREKKQAWMEEAPPNKKPQRPSDPADDETYLYPQLVKDLLH